MNNILGINKSLLITIYRTMMNTYSWHYMVYLEFILWKVVH